MPPHSDSHLRRAALAAQLGITPLGKLHNGRISTPQYVYTMQCGHNEAYADIQLQRRAPHYINAPNLHPMVCQVCQGRKSNIPPEASIMPFAKDERTVALRSHRANAAAQVSAAMPSDLHARMDDIDAKFAALLPLLQTFSDDIDAIRANLGMPSV